MSSAERTFLAVAAGLVAFAATYFVSPPAPRYYPLSGEWRMERRPEKPSMGWYGRSAWGLAAALAAGGLVGWVSGRGRGRWQGLSAGTIRLVTTVVLTSLGALAGYIVVANFREWGIW